MPNDYSVLQLKAEEELDVGKRWWVAPPQHLNYFTPVSLSKLILRAGFDILEVRGTWPMEHYLFSGYNYIGNDQVGRMCHQNRMETEINIENQGQWLLQRSELQGLIGQGIGREVFILARPHVE